MKIGLGTDVSGGCSSSLLEVIRMAVAATNTLGLLEKEYKPLTYKELFALATLGGAQVLVVVIKMMKKVLGLDNLIGNFQVGKFFDALVVNPESQQNTFEVYEHDKMEDVFQKFIFLGDDRSIEKIYVSGVVVKQ